MHIVSAYGLFSGRTTERDEIIIEGSNDGVEWRDYEFIYKPGDVARRPRWNIPHSGGWTGVCGSPRRGPRGLPWFSRSLARLLENEPTVTALLERNPFPDKAARLGARPV